MCFLVDTINARTEKVSVLILTSFGRLIYHSLLIIATACRHSSELIMVDAVKSTAGMSDNEQKDLIDKLIRDPGFILYKGDDDNKAFWALKANQGMIYTIDGS